MFSLTQGGAAGSLGGGSSSGVGNVGGYGSHYPPPPSIPAMEGATALDPAEMKYSCTMDFRSQGRHPVTNSTISSKLSVVKLWVL